ncbi:hypothetical protein OB955_21090 [Halobacteria archaeon AArc-m2/3/4]|uniref:Uncharacterized protein n=1 Tax=Natronoglomus mannanivorans TaxID=2979990 RepID=A0AAP2YZ79_9EURY|nr:hypothetical protein [Halobacteria archaeon AArc-xg1-1]MCU4975200.1 hypothetical protein [Halobacteria archaeon AArc-m2/3/4]
MNELTYAILETDAETALPMEIVGWAVLGVSLLITVAWLFYLYR